MHGDGAIGRGVDPRGQTCRFGHCRRHGPDGIADGLRVELRQRGSRCFEARSGEHGAQGARRDQRRRRAPAGDEGEQRGDIARGQRAALVHVVERSIPGPRLGRRDTGFSPAEQAEDAGGVGYIEEAVAVDVADKSAAVDRDRAVERTDHVVERRAIGVGRVVDRHLDRREHAGKRNTAGAQLDLRDVGHTREIGHAIQTDRRIDDALGFVNHDIGQTKRGAAEPFEFRRFQIRRVILDAEGQAADLTGAAHPDGHRDEAAFVDRVGVDHGERTLGVINDERAGG